MPGQGPQKYPFFLLFLSFPRSRSIPACLSLSTFVFLCGRMSLCLPLSSLLPLPSPPLRLLPEGSSPSVGARLPEGTMAWSREVLGLSPWSHNSHVQPLALCQGPRDRDASSSWVLCGCPAFRTAPLSNQGVKARSQYPSLSLISPPLFLVSIISPLSLLSFPSLSSPLFPSPLSPASSLTPFSGRAAPQKAGVRAAFLGDQMPTVLRTVQISAVPESNC